MEKIIKIGDFISLNVLFLSSGKFEVSAAPDGLAVDVAVAYTTNPYYCQSSCHEQNEKRPTLTLGLLDHLLVWVSLLMLLQS